MLAATGRTPLADADLAGALTTLKGRGVRSTRRRSTRSPSTPSSDPLTQEVALGSQLQEERRRQVHAAVARALEAKHMARRGDEHAALLAHHWDLGGEVEPAARWHRRAAEWITGSNAPEARRHWQRVRELADRIGDAALAAELGQQSRLMILEYGWRLGMSEEEANELLQEGEAWARRHDDSRGLAALYNAFAIPAAFVFGDPGRARDLSAAGLRLAEEAGDGPLSCALELRLYFSAVAFGRVPDEAAWMEAVQRRSAEDMERASPLVGYDVPALVTAYRGWPAFHAGRLDVAHEHFHRGVEVARARGALEVTGWILGLMSQALVRTRRRRPRLGRGAREPGHCRADRQRPAPRAWLCASSVARSRSRATPPPRCRRWNGPSPSLRARYCFWEPEALSDLALAHCSLGALTEAEATAERALERAVRCSALRGEVWRSTPSPPSASRAAATRQRWPSATAPRPRRLAGGRDRLRPHPAAPTGAAGGISPDSGATRPRQGLRCERRTGCTRRWAPAATRSASRRRSRHDRRGLAVAHPPSTGGYRRRSARRGWSEAPVNCAGCDHVNPERARFCLECGTALQAPGGASQLHTAAPRSYTPGHLAETILTARSAVEGERKQVTVLFAT